jgi:hypothetical protein
VCSIAFIERRKDQEYIVCPSKINQKLKNGKIARGRET